LLQCSRIGKIEHTRPFVNAASKSNHGGVKSLTDTDAHDWSAVYAHLGVGQQGCHQVKQCHCMSKSSPLNLPPLQMQTIAGSCSALAKDMAVDKSAACKAAFLILQDTKAILQRLIQFQCSSASDD
jgi:hypothetical protein